MKKYFISILFLIWLSLWINPALASNIDDSCKINFVEIENNKFTPNITIPKGYVWVIVKYSKEEYPIYDKETNMNEFSNIEFPQNTKNIYLSCIWIDSHWNETPLMAKEWKIGKSIAKTISITEDNSIITYEEISKIAKSNKKLFEWIKSDVKVKLLDILPQYIWTQTSIWNKKLWTILYYSIKYNSWK